MTEPVEGACNTDVTIRALPIAVSHNDTLAIPLKHLAARLAGLCEVHE